LKRHIEDKHPGAVPGSREARPFGIDWDAWYVIC